MIFSAVVFQALDSDHRLASIIYHKSQILNGLCFA